MFYFFIYSYTSTFLPPIYHIELIYLHVSFPLIKEKTTLHFILLLLRVCLLLDTRLF